MRPVFAELKLQVDQKRTKVAKLYNPLFILKTSLCLFKRPDDHKLSTKTLQISLKLVRKPIELVISKPLFELICSVINIKLNECIIVKDSD